MSNDIPLGRVAKAGALTGVVLYFACLVVYLFAFKGEGDWMLQPFMPGLSMSAFGLAVGLVWSVAYGAGILWLLGFFFNAVGSSQAQVSAP